MTQKITVRVGGLVGSTIWDATGQVPTFDVEGSSVPMLDAAHMFGGEGNASQFEFMVDDDIGEIPRVNLTKNLASHNVVTITEDASGDELWLARGRIADKGWGRGTMVIGDARGAKVRVDDGNIDFRGLALVADWPRPDETGRARVLAALAALCDGDPRLTTVIATHLVAAGGEVAMPAKTYPAGTDLPEIFRDCAEVEAKLWGAVIHHSGGSHLCMEYITKGDHTTYASTLSITDDGPNHTTSFPPIWDQGDASIESGGDNPISHLVSRYGLDEAAFVVATNPNIVDAYDYWAEPYNDSASVSPAEASARADGIAGGRATEHVTHQVTILVPADKVHLVEAGMSIVIRAAAAMGGQYLGTNQTRRIAQCKKEKVSPGVADSDGHYLLHLQLDRPEKRRGESTGSLALVTAKTAFNAAQHYECDCAYIDEFTRSVPTTWGDTPLGCKTWQSSVNGEHSVDGAVATQLILVTDEDASVWLDEMRPHWNGGTVDFKAKVRGPNGGSAKCFIAYESDGTVNDDGPFDDPSTIRVFRWKWALDADGDVFCDVLAFRGAVGISQGAIDAGVNADGVDFWVRCQLTATVIRMKAWADGDPEPGGWTSEVSDGALDALNGIGDCDIFATKIFGGVGSPLAGDQQWVNSLEFTSGVTWDCDQPSSLMLVAQRFVSMGDGSLVDFTIPLGGGYVSGSLDVEVDGLHQNASETDPGSGTFRLEFAPDADESVYASWRAA